MADILLPPWIHCARARMRYRDNTGLSRGEYTGQVLTADKGGDKLEASIEFTPAGGSSAQTAMERAALIAFLARLRGRRNRPYLFDVANRLRGSFPAAELLTNNTLESGTTGWSSSSVNVSISVSDRTLRAVRSDVTSGIHTVRPPAFTVSDAYSPHVFRVFLMLGRGVINSRLVLGTSAGNNDIATGSVFAAQGLQSLVGVHPSGGNNASVYDIATGRIPGDYYEISYASVSRCLLVDNGANTLLQSDEFDTTWAATRSSVDDQAGVAPDGASTADSIIEDSSASTTHYVQQNVTIPSAVNDYAFAVTLKSGARNFAQLSLIEGTGSESAVAYFDIATGVVGDTGVGTNWANIRASVVALGNGWYYCCIVARKTNSATVLSARLSISSTAATGGVTYTGNGTSNILAWRATLAQSSVPTRLIATTTTASTGTSQTGSALHVKGLPVSANGLLLPNDQFEVITSRGSELKIVTSALNSDAAGLGYLQFEPPLRGAPADNAPIILHQPMGRFIFTGEFPEWSTEPGFITTASAEFEEAA